MSAMAAKHAVGAAGSAALPPRIWSLAVIVLLVALPGHALRPEADRHRARSGPHRDHDAGRGLRGPRRQPAGRDGAGRRRHDGPHVGHAPRRPAPIPTGSCSRSPIPPTSRSSAGSTAERYSMVGSGAVWPDLDARRIEAVTPSVGYVPERIKSDRADMFRITLEPGQTITYVAELASDRFARLYLWKPIEYELKSRDRQLFNGIMLGLTGLLAIFLTAVFAANHKAIFPTAALVDVVRAGLSVRRLRLLPQAVQLAAGGQRGLSRRQRSPRWPRASSFSSPTFLRLAFWHGLVRMLFARVDVGAAGAGRRGGHRSAPCRHVRAHCRSCASAASAALFTLFLAMRGQDRALSLVPTWMLFLVWMFGAGMTLTGRLSGDIVVARPRRRPGADRHADRLHRHAVRLPLAGAALRRRAGRAAVAVAGRRRRRLGGVGMERAPRRDQGQPGIEASLGLKPGELSHQGRRLHQAHAPDRPRALPLMLWSVKERPGAECAPSSACATPTTAIAGSSSRRRACRTPTRRALRCVGLMREVTDAKRAHERLLHDAVHDSLTGLPNRELFLDRLASPRSAPRSKRRRAPERHVHRHRQVQERERLVRPRASATACC